MRIKAGGMIFDSDHLTDAELRELDRAVTQAAETRSGTRTDARVVRLEAADPPTDPAAEHEQRMREMAGPRSTTLRSDATTKRAPKTSGDPAADHRARMNALASGRNDDGDEAA